MAGIRRDENSGFRNTLNSDSLLMSHYHHWWWWFVTFVSNECHEAPFGKLVFIFEVIVPTANRLEVIYRGFIEIFSVKSPSVSPRAPATPMRMLYGEPTEMYSTLRTPVSLFRTTFPPPILA